MDKKANEVISSKECINISQLEVNGVDIAALGADGKRIGEVLECLLDLVIEGKIDNIKSVLIDKARMLLNKNS